MGITNASSDNIATNGQTLAVGKGATSISSSINNQGTVNNIQAAKGGKSSASWGQTGDSAASSTEIKKGTDGSSQVVNNASGKNWSAKAANQDAFLGKGSASTGIGANGIDNNVSGSEGAANANSFDSTLKNTASSVNSKIAGPKAPVKQNKDTKKFCAAVRHRRRLQRKRNRDDDSSSSQSSDSLAFASINNASSDNSATSGQTSAMGKGATHISSSIGNHGTVNNIKAANGGKSAASWKQVGDSAASSTGVRKGKDGKSRVVNNASDNNWNAKGANQNAFLGQGDASTAIGADGVDADVYGSKGAANANSFDSVLKSNASSQALNNAAKNKKKNRKPKHHKKCRNDADDN